MIAREVFIQFQPNKIEEGRRIYTEQIAPELRKQKGNVEAFLMEPKNPGEEFIALTLWNTEADAEQYEKSGKYDELAGKVKSLVTGQLKVKRFEVKKHFH